MNSTQLNKQIKTLEQKRELLMSQWEQARSRQEDAQDWLIEKATDTHREKAAAAYATVSALKEAIAEIDSHLGSLRSNLATCEAEEAQAEAKRQVSAQQEKSETAFVKYADQRRAPYEHLREHAPQCVEAWRNYRREAGALSSMTGEYSRPPTPEPLDGPYILLDELLNRLLSKERRRSKADIVERERGREERRGFYQSAA